jgi:TatD DNase family protein
MQSNNLLNLNSLADTHAHLNDLSFDNDRDKVVQNSISQGTKYIYDVGINLTSSNKAIENAKKYYPNVKAFVGIDPEIFIPGSSLFISKTSQKFINQQINNLRSLIIQNQKLIAGIGETGLDFYWLQKKIKTGDISKSEFETSIENQKILFIKHLELANEFKLVLTVHSRGAEKDVLDIVKKYKVNAIFHSYTGNFETAKKILDAGCGLGVNGIITFPNAQNLRNLYKKILGKVSADWSVDDFYAKSVFFETDCPFLAPQGLRGQRNTPENITVIFQKFIEFLS